MKKLEKLNEKKFKAFEGEKIADLAKLVGGTPVPSYSTPSGTTQDDTIDTATNNGATMDGKPIDYVKCSAVVTSVGPLMGSVTYRFNTFNVYNCTFGI